MSQFEPDDVFANKQNIERMFKDSIVTSSAFAKREGNVIKIVFIKSTDYKNLNNGVSISLPLESAIFLKQTLEEAISE